MVLSVKLQHRSMIRNVDYVSWLERYLGKSLLPDFSTRLILNAKSSTVTNPGKLNPALYVVLPAYTDVSTKSGDRNRTSKASLVSIERKFFVLQHERQNNT